MNARARLPVSLAAAMVVTLGWLGCADEAPLAGLKEGCMLSSDCNDPLVCAFKKCHVQCKSSKDCDDGRGRCVVSEKPYYVCQFDEDAKCVRNSDCAGQQVCAADGACHDQCASARDCLSDDVCVEGVCARVAETKDGRLLTPAEAPEPEGTRCLHSTDCPGDLVCKEQVCTAECVSDKDCVLTWTCKALQPGGAGRCHPPQ